MTEEISLNHVTFWKSKVKEIIKSTGGAKGLGAWGDAHMEQQGVFKAVKLFCVVLQQYIWDITHLANMETCKTQKT